MPFRCLCEGTLPLTCHPSAYSQLLRPAERYRSPLLPCLQRCYQHYTSPSGRNYNTLRSSRPDIEAGRAYQRFHAKPLSSHASTGAGGQQQGEDSQEAKDTTTSYLSGRSSAATDHNIIRPRSKQYQSNGLSEKSRDDLKIVLEALQDTIGNHDIVPIPQLNRPEPSRPINFSQSPVVRRYMKKGKKDQQKKQSSGTTEPLKDDPWAQMLAAPLRYDTASGARVPRALLTDWSFVRHPTEEQDVYIMPTGLVKSMDQSKSIGNTYSKRESISTEGDNDQSLTPNPEMDEAGNEQLDMAIEAHASTQASVEPSVHHEEINSESLEPLIPGHQSDNTSAIRILPFYNLIRHLSTALTVQNHPHDPSVRKHHRSGTIQMIPTSWKVQLSEAQHYVRHRQDVAKKSGVPDIQPPSEEANFELKDVKWKVDISIKVLNIMRQRLVNLLKRVIELNSSERGMQLRRMNVLAVDVLYSNQQYSEDEPAAETDLGSITREDINQTSENAANSSTSSETSSSMSEQDQYTNDTQAIRGPRTLLYFGPHPSATLDQLDISTAAVRPPHTETTAATLNLLPPLLASNPSLSQPPTYPVFPLKPLLGEEQYTSLHEHIQQHPFLFEHPVFLPQTATRATRQRAAPIPPNEFIFALHPHSPCNDMLIHEIWQLWRYVGGRRALDPELKGGIDELVAEEPWDRTAANTQREFRDKEKDKNRDDGGRLDLLRVLGRRSRKDGTDRRPLDDEGWEV